MRFEGFLRFLDGACSLKRLRVMFGIVDDDVFTALAPRPDQQSLEF